MRLSLWPPPLEACTNTPSPARETNVKSKQPARIYDGSPSKLSESSAGSAASIQDKLIFQPRSYPRKRTSEPTRSSNLSSFLPSFLPPSFRPPPTRPPPLLPPPPLPFDDWIFIGDDERTDRQALCSLHAPLEEDAPSASPIFRRLQRVAVTDTGSPV